MRVLGWIGLLTLAGCEADGRPSKMIGSALGAFSKGYNDTSAAIEKDRLEREANQPARSASAMQPAPAAVPQPSTLAFFTGSARQVSTVTGAMAWQCGYHYGGQDFELTLPNYCPPTVPIR